VSKPVVRSISGDRKRPRTTNQIGQQLHCDSTNNSRDARNLSWAHGLLFSCRAENIPVTIKNCRDLVEREPGCEQRHDIFKFCSRRYNAIVSKNGLGAILVFFKHRIEHFHCPVSRKPFIIVVRVEEHLTDNNVDYIFAQMDPLLFALNCNTRLIKGFQSELVEKQLERFRFACLLGQQLQIRGPLFRMLLKIMFLDVVGTKTVPVLKLSSPATTLRCTRAAGV
jgi:hypothetical protein